MLLVLFVVRTQAITCPQSADLSSCYCTNIFTLGQASPYCVSQNKDYAKMGQILNNYLTAGEGQST
jgi:hypothetical protein